MCLSPRSAKTCFKDVLSCLGFLEGHRELGFYVPSWFVYSHSEIKALIQMETVAVVFCD